MASSRVWNRTAVRVAGACCLVLLLVVAGVPGASVASLQQVTINQAVMSIVTTTTAPPGTIACQDPYTCLFPGEADQKWGSGNYLSAGSTPCGYSTALATAVVAKYCYAQIVSCQDPCQCLSPVEARQKWGAQMSQCSASPCGKTIPLSDTLPATKYCYQQKSASVTVQPVVTGLTLQQVSCPAGTTLCIGTAISCVNTSSDARNCGACGKGCPSLQSCVNGQCRTNLVVAQTMNPCLVQGKASCSGTCIDTSTDVDNCGACGNQCDYGFKCIDGQCSLGCAQGYAECRYDCVNLLTDNRNCGDCGTECPPTKDCVQGHCTDLCSLGPSHFSNFSWRNWQGTNWVSPVTDQHQCGSCWAFGSVGATEAVYNIEHGYVKNIDISEQELVSPCFGNGNAGDCLGGDYEKALGYLKSNGIVAESGFPYQSFNEVHPVPNADDPTKSHDECNVQKTHCSTPSTCWDISLGNTRWGITSTGDVTADIHDQPSNIHDMKKALLCHGPLVVGSDGWWHVVTLVGWDDATQQWTVKNSWGTDPNWDGYNQIHYYNDFNSDIQNHTTWVQGVTGP